MENKINLEQKKDFLIVNFSGEIDSNFAPKYRLIIDMNLDKQMNDVVFDFSNTTFIDSSGIGLVLGRYNLLRDNGCKLTITGLNKTAYKLFDLTGIFKIIEYKEEITC